MLRKIPIGRVFLKSRGRAGSRRDDWAGTGPQRSCLRIGAMWL